MLVMAPTRELAIQVHNEMQKIGRSLSILCVYGQTPYGPQGSLSREALVCQPTPRLTPIGWAIESSFRQGVDIVVGTPGRIIDHIHRGTLKLTSIQFVVMDEADEMLSIGFLKDMEEVLAAIPKYASDLVLERTNERTNERAALLLTCALARSRLDRDQQHQTCLFSATVPGAIRDVARRFLQPGYAMIDLVGNQENQAAKKVRHYALCCDWKSRASILGDLVKVHAGVDGRAIIFTNTKAECNQLALSSSLGGGTLAGTLVE